MLKYRLKEKNDNEYTYEYFPEGDYSKESGIIIVDTVADTVCLKRVAEKDFERYTTAEELNDMRNAINQMRAENGDSPLTEEELPIATEGSRWYYYANHAIDKLCGLINSGEEPAEGMVAWY